MRNGPEQGQSLQYSLFEISYAEKKTWPWLTKWLLWFSNSIIVLIDDSTYFL